MKKVQNTGDAQAPRAEFLLDVQSGNPMSIEIPAGDVEAFELPKSVTSALPATFDIETLRDPVEVLGTVVRAFPIGQGQLTTATASAQTFRVLFQPLHAANAITVLCNVPNGNDAPAAGADASILHYPVPGVYHVQVGRRAQAQDGRKPSVQICTVAGYTPLKVTRFVNRTRDQVEAATAVRRGLAVGAATTEA